MSHQSYIHKSSSDLIRLCFIQLKIFSDRYNNKKSQLFKIFFILHKNSVDYIRYSTPKYPKLKIFRRKRHIFAEKTLGDSRKSAPYKAGKPAAIAQIHRGRIIRDNSEQLYGGNIHAVVELCLPALLHFGAYHLIHYKPRRVGKRSYFSALSKALRRDTVSGVVTIIALSQIFAAKSKAVPQFSASNNI